MAITTQLALPNGYHQTTGSTKWLSPHNWLYNMAITRQLALPNGYHQTTGSTKWLSPHNWLYQMDITKQLALPNGYHHTTGSTIWLSPDNWLYNMAITRQLALPNGYHQTTGSTKWLSPHNWLYQMDITRQLALQYGYHHTTGSNKWLSPHDWLYQIAITKQLALPNGYHHTMGSTEWLSPHCSMVLSLVWTSVMCHKPACVPCPNLTPMYYLFLSKLYTRILVRPSPNYASYFPTLSAHLRPSHPCGVLLHDMLWLQVENLERQTAEKIEIQRQLEHENFKICSEREMKVSWRTISWQTRVRHSLGDLYMNVCKHVCITMCILLWLYRQKWPDSSKRNWVSACISKTVNPCLGYICVGIV